MAGVFDDAPGIFSMATVYLVKILQSAPFDFHVQQNFARRKLFIENLLGNTLDVSLLHAKRTKKIGVVVVQLGA